MKLFLSFVLFALKPLNQFSVLFQTHASRVGTLHHDMNQLLRSFMSNFIDPDIIKNSDDITAVDFTEKEIQLSDRNRNIYKNIVM